MDSHADDRIFGTVIAYVFPGLVMLWGIAYVAHPVDTWLRQVAAGDLNTAGALLLAVAATGLGACANAARWFLLERILGRWRPLPEEWLDHTKRKDEGVERAYQNSIQAHYRFYQHAGNTLVALLTSCALWGVSHLDNWKLYAAAGLLLVAAAILAMGAKDAQHKGYQKQRRLLGVSEMT